MPALPASIHRASQPKNYCDPFSRAVHSLSHEFCDLAEDLKIPRSSGEEWEAFEERNDAFEDLLQTVDLEVVHAIRSAAPYASTRQRSLKDPQDCWIDLRNIESQRSSPRNTSIPACSECDEETSLAVRETR